MKLTEIQAWEFIREAFRDKNLVEIYGQIHAQCPDDAEPLLGMCDVVKVLRERGLVSWETHDDMLHKLKQAVISKLNIASCLAWSEFLYPNTRYGARKRREFCTKMIKDLTDQK
jgi:hypothetical protein